jgi:hypothetical protein
VFALSSTTEVTMFSISLGDDGAELRPLEPWQAEEFLAHMDRGRESIGRYIALPDAVTDLESSRSFLQQYAEKAAADTGRIYGTWVNGKLVGGVLFRTMDVEHGNAEAGCWLEPAAAGRGLATRAARVIIDWAIEEPSTVWSGRCWRRSGGRASKPPHGSCPENAEGPALRERGALPGCVDQIARTSWACGPFCPWPTSNSTRCPSSRDLNPEPDTEE